MSDANDDVPQALTDRRPISSRDTGWAQALARWAVARHISANVISVASMGFAALTAVAFVLLASVGPGASGVVWLLLAALGCQLRLVCNLIDGMVAVEGQRSSATGPFWNEFPDRVSDVVILAAAGVVAEMATLGWVAAALAVATAYVRELGHRLTGTVSFRGWMAKPQRMAVITLACIVAIAARWLDVLDDAQIFMVALVVVCIGALWVVVARVKQVLFALGEIAEHND